MFKVGRKVELSFSQLSYRDAWFPGCLLQDLGNGRFLTEYCSSDNNNKTKPLKVVVDLLHIRPCPPVLQDKRFVLLEKVDAYFNFGWWSGVIAKELEDNSYVLFFKHTRKAREFRQSELRPHMEWKDGKWLTSQLSLDVSVLEPFEVKCKQQTHERLGGTSAFVPSSNSGNKNGTSINMRNYQFEQSTSPSVSVKPAHGMRSVAQKRMNLSELHDVVSLLPKKRKEGNVVEPSQQDKHSRSSSKSLSGCVSPGSVGNMINFAVQSAANPSSVAVQYATNPSSDNSLSGDRTVQKQGNAGSTTTRTDDIANATSGSKQSTLQVESPEPILGGIQSFARVQKQGNVGSATTRTDDIVNATSGSKQSTLQVEIPEPILGCVQSFARVQKQGNVGSTITRTDDIVNATSGSKQSTLQVESPEPILGCVQFFARVQKQENVGSTTTRTDEFVNATSGSKQSTSSGSKQSTLQVESPKPTLGGNEGFAAVNKVAAVRDTETDNIQSPSGEKQSERHVIVGLPCAAETTGLTELLTRRGERALRSITKQLMKHGNDQIHQLDDDTPTKKLKEDSKLSEFVHRKRGRPRKTPLKILRNPVTRSTLNGDADSDTRNDSPHAIPHVLATSPNQGDNSIFCEEDKLLADGETISKNGRNISRCATLAKMKQHEKEASSDSVRLGHESSIEAGGWTKFMAEALMPEVDGSINVSGAMEIDLDSNKEVEEVVTEAPNNEIDYEPVTGWILESRSPPILDGSVTSPVSTVEQCAEERVDTDTAPEDENANQKNVLEANPPLIEKCSVNRTEQQIWLKHSVLWKTIESMEVFQRLPQNPHFEPLNSFKESSREGLAIGYMVTFSSVVEKTSSLQFNDNKSVTDDILETLDDLEKHGFDVKVVRDRVTGLLTLKNKQGELIEEVDVLNSQILVHVHEKTHIDETIHETSEKIRKLQETLSAAEAAKEKENGEINSLQGKLVEAEHGVSSLKREFESIAASSLQ